MKTNLILFILIILILPLVVSAENTINSKIEKVTVYRNGAFITRTGEASIPAGYGSFIIYGRSDQIDPATARIHGKGDFEIISIRHKNDFITPLEDNEEVKNLKDQKEKITRQFKENDLDKSVLEEELKLLNGDKLISSSDQKLSVEQMNALMDFYRNRMRDIKHTLFEIEESSRVLKKDLSSIENQIKQLSRTRKKVSQFIVETYATRDVKSPIELKYWTNQAQWTSLYDVRLSDIAKPLEIQSNASVSNATGEDWENVYLTLSTGNPWRSMQIPTMSPWWINFRSAYPSIYYQDGVQLKPESMMQNMRTQSRKKESDAIEEIVIRNYEQLPATEVSENMTTMEFKIAGKRSIPSNRLPNTIKLETNDAQAKFKYVAVPSKSNYAFLKATIHDFQNFNFSYGEASLYFEGTYIGKTVLNPRQASDSLDISFGPDIAVVVTREKSKDYSEKKWFGMKRSETIGFDIEVKNNKGTDIDIQILDRIPVSNNEAIVVDALETGNAKLSKETGILTWRVKLGSASTFKDKVGYKVTYPKNEVLASLN